MSGSPDTFMGTLITVASSRYSPQVTVGSLQKKSLMLLGVWVGPGFELKASHLLGRCSTT
jgi:hypothetical protein